MFPPALRAEIYAKYKSDPFAWTVQALSANFAVPQMRIQTILRAMRDANMSLVNDTRLKLENAVVTKLTPSKIPRVRLALLKVDDEVDEGRTPIESNPLNVRYRRTNFDNLEVKLNRESSE